MLCQTFTFLALSILALVVTASAAKVPNCAITSAVAVVSGAASTVTGTVIFQQNDCGSVTITGILTGLDENAMRGFHVHQYGNLTSGCDAAGPHYNPFNTPHGAPSDPPNRRHVGDLGNIQSDANGNAIFTMTDDLLTLNGPLSIMGRSVVVHTETDDLGRGGSPLSLATGNSGPTAACGVIGVAGELVTSV